MIQFSPPKIRPEVFDEIKDTISTGWISTGPKTKQFEKDLTAYCGNKITNALGSATAGMSLVLHYLGIGEGDEVIIPAYTYCATANVVFHSGAKIVMVDVSPGSFNIDVAKVEAAITSRTKAIVPVDIGGFPCDYEELYAIIERHKSKFTPSNEMQEKMGRIVLLADAAHSFGATYKGKKSGSLADISVFSFHAVKNLTTAEGGCICWNLPEDFDHDKIHKEINTMSLHGQNKDALAKYTTGGWRYDVEQPGFKCNMTDIHACIGLVELRHYQERLDKRKEIVDAYQVGFGAEKWAILPEIVNTDKSTSYHLYLLRIDGCSEAQRDAIVTEVMNNGVSTNVHFLPVPMLSAYKNLGYEVDDYPNTLAQYSNEISIPLHCNLTEEDVQTVIRVVSNVINKTLGA